ncbi:cyclin [Ascodesmis nigricans]|uniref:RNA polymerase II holoenzyme cyclin-like subunit n=1 Tax=Ascodesmis nigricans TaxID=341454 RepID=A0A4S2N2X3_9PEZI|nr:cyclin [Ascodesmis nigricans]
MAANYWASSQRLHWQMSRAKLAETRRALDAMDEKVFQDFPLPHYRLLSIYFNQQLIRLGRRMQTRQQALATAQLYVRRFYTKVAIRDTNPYLVLATCLYLALKIEECPQHIRIVVNEARTCWPEYMPADTAKLAECEFWLISEMNSFLIVHHPYRTLRELKITLKLTDSEEETASQVINDSCVTDLPLLYPPHVIAVTAIFLTVVLKPSSSMGAFGSSVSNLRVSSAAAAAAAAAAANTMNAQERLQHVVNWFANSKVDMEAIIDCTQEIISLYEVWESYSATGEKSCREMLGRLVKQRGL